MTAPALSEFESMVDQLVAMGVPREKAIATARAETSRLRTDERYDDSPSKQRADNVREKEEQAYIAKLFRGFGCKVYNLSQARASKQTPGLPDLWVVAQWRRRQDSAGRIVGDGVMHEHARAFWFEVKRASGGRISDAQHEFREECDRAGVLHYVGDRRTAAKVLVDLGLARPGDGPCGIVPFHQSSPLTKETP